MKPSPAFQMYPSDWISSQRVQMLTLEEEGAYIRLICFCWQHGSIPSDPDMCARLIGKGGSTTVARVVQAMFEPHPDDPSRLVHDRLNEEREKQAVWREKSSAGGRKSAQMRAEKATSDHVSPTESPKSKGGSRVVEDWLEPNGNTSSSSSSSSTIPCDKSREGFEPKPSKPKKPKEEKQPPDPRHAELIRSYCEAYEERTGMRYTFQSRDAKALQTFLRANQEPTEKIIKILRWAWSQYEEGGQFAKSYFQCATIHDLCSSWPKIVMAGS